MSYVDYRVQVLANAKCLYGSEIEVLIFSHKSGSQCKYQAAAMKRENHDLPWVNILFSKAEGSRQAAMRALLQKTEDELAKNLREKGVTLPFLGDDSTGFEVTHLVRRGSAMSLSEGSEGSEFEFVATPASSSAGDFSEDESVKEVADEQDAHIEPIPTSVEAQVVQTGEKSPLQPSIIPVEIFSEPLDPATKSPDAMTYDDPHVYGVQGTATITGKDNAPYTLDKEATHSPWGASAMPDEWRRRSERWAARKIPKDDIKSGPWADIVEELDGLTQKTRYVPKESKSSKYTSSPKMVGSYSPTAEPRKFYTNTWGPKWECEDDTHWEEKEISGDDQAGIKRTEDDQWANWISQPKTKSFKGKEIAKDASYQHTFQPRKTSSMHEDITQVKDKSKGHDHEHDQLEPLDNPHALIKPQAAIQTTMDSNAGITSDDSLKIVQTLAEWVKVGIPLEKMSKLRELIDDSPFSKAKGTSASTRQVLEGNTSTSNSATRVPAFLETTGSEEKKRELKLKHHSLSDDLFVSRPFHTSQASSSTVSRASLDDHTAPVTLAEVSSPADTDSWGTWPLPAKKKKSKMTAYNVIGVSSPQKLNASSSNPWSTNIAWREPEAVLDEYNSSLWGISKITKQKKSPNVAPMAISGPKPSENESASSPTEHDVKRTAEPSISPLSTAERTVQPNSSRLVPKSPELKPVPIFNGWSSLGISTMDKEKSSVAVVLPEPEPEESTYRNQFEAKPKNPFDRMSKNSKHIEPKLNIAEKDSWNFGTFTSKQDLVAEMIPHPATEKDPWSWKTFTSQQEQQKKEVENVSKVAETTLKISPWPYLEPESRPTAVASISHQSLLDDLAEWGSFSNTEKPKTKKPVAFDYLVESPLEIASKTDFKHKEVTVKSPYDDFEWGSFGSQKNNSKKEKSALKDRTRYADFNENGGFGTGFGTFSVADTSKPVELSNPDFAWKDLGTKKGKNTKRDDSTVSEMSGEDKPATTPVHGDAQKVYRSNILGLNKPKKAPRTDVSHTPIQPSQALRTRLYVLNITYRHLLATEHFRHIIDASFTKKAAIIKEINKFISAREPFGQIYKRKIVIHEAKGEDGVIELERLEEGSWEDILGFLEETTRVIEITVMVNDI